MTCEAFLDDVIRKFGNLRDRADSALAGLTEDQFNQPIPAFHWTLAQIVEHVLLSHGLYIASIEEGLEHPLRKVKAEIQFSFVGTKIAKFAGPNGNVPVPQAARPDTSKRYPLALGNEFLEQTEALAELARRSVGVNLGAVKVRNPFVPILKMTLADCYQIPERHLEHHVQQLEKYRPIVDAIAR